MILVACRTWKQKVLQNLEAESFADLAETEGNLCRSLDSALCMVSSVLQLSPMAGEMFP